MTAIGRIRRLRPKSSRVLADYIIKSPTILMWHFRRRDFWSDMMYKKCVNRRCARLCGSLALFVCISLVLNGCAKQLTPFGKARMADTIEAYEEFMRTSPHDPRVRYARSRIEALRLLEAHRSGTVPVDAPNRGASQERFAVPVEPTNMRQGPWNLSAALPRSSKFTLDLYHGRSAPVPHKLIVDQQGQRVIYTLQHGSGPDAYYLTAGVPFESFRRLWAAVFASDIGLYKSSYGRVASTGDYRGDLIIEVDTGTERLSRVIRLEGLTFDDENLRGLLKSMAQMHPQDHGMHFFQ